METTPMALKSARSKSSFRAQVNVQTEFEGFCLEMALLERAAIAAHYPPHARKTRAVLAIY